MTRVRAINAFITDAVSYLLKR